jgi:recombination protein U
MASRGSDLEKRVNKANTLYKKEKSALIMKVAVPILYTRKGMVATSSTVDYTGVLNGGRFLAMDAKETQSKTSFALKNIHQHQLTYLQYVRDLGGIAFFLIHFKKVHSDKAYIVPIEKVEEYQVEGMRKSIPIKEFLPEWLVDIDNYLENIQPKQ